MMSDTATKGCSSRSEDQAPSGPCIAIRIHEVGWSFCTPACHTFATGMCIWWRKRLCCLSCTVELNQRSALLMNLGQNPATRECKASVADSQVARCTLLPRVPSSPGERVAAAQSEQEIPTGSPFSFSPQQPWESSQCRLWEMHEPIPSSITLYFTNSPGRALSRYTYLVALVAPDRARVLLS